MELHRPLYMCGSFVKHKENGQEQVHHPLNVNEECQGEKYCVTLTNQKHGRESSRSHTHFNAFECTVSTHTHTHIQSLKCPHGRWSCGAINCTVLSEWPRPAMGSWVKVVEEEGGGDEGGGCFRSALIPGETPWWARCVAGALHARTHPRMHAHTHTHTHSLSLSLSLSAGTHLKQESTATSRLAANKTRLHCPGWGHNVPRPRSCQLVTADNGTHTQSMCGGEREKKRHLFFFCERQ